VADRRLVLASHNAHKVEELARILAETGALPGWEVVGAAGLPGVGEVAETEVTFEGNALLKARAVCVATGVAAVADDSGLCVDALNGCPGVFSARWAGPGRDDAANLDLLLGQLHDVPDEHRGAAFVCAVAVVLPDGRELLTHGRMPGRLIRQRRGTGGFGYDPIFVADGGDRTNAELSPAQKDAISHRGLALRAMAPLLAEALAATV
jgi:XTP/dITP diphosphohydrolase